MRVLASIISRSVRRLRADGERAGALRDRSRRAGIFGTRPGLRSTATTAKRTSPRTEETDLAVQPRRVCLRQIWTMNSDGGTSRMVSPTTGAHLLLFLPGRQADRLRFHQPPARRCPPTAVPPGKPLRLAAVSLRHLHGEHRRFDLTRITANPKYDAERWSQPMEGDRLRLAARRDFDVYVMNATDRTCGD